MSPVPADVHVVRPDDLVVLTFRFRDLELTGPAGRPQLVAATQLGLLMVELPPQAFGEEALPEQLTSQGKVNPPPDQLPGPGRVGLRPGRPSRLVFEVAKGAAPIEYSLVGLLDACRRLPMRPPNPAGLPIPKLLPTVTQLEVPYGLILAAEPNARWFHSPMAVSAEGATELWNTRLGSAGTGEGDRIKPLRLRGCALGLDTIGPEDYGKSPNTHTTLTPDQRKDIVAYGDTNDPALGFDVNLLMLTPLGAWFDAHGSWEGIANRPGDLLEWTHRMTMGRDHYVRVVDAGFLFPLGHPAVHVQISQRKLQRRSDVGPVAYLRQRHFVVVRIPDVDYADERDLPFRRATLTTAVTPDLVLDESLVQPKGTAGGKGFWIKVAEDRDFPFPVVAHDRKGNRVEFLASLAFVRASDDVKEFIKAFPATEKERTRATWLTGGRPVTFAPRRNEHSDSTYETTSIGAGARVVAPNQPPANPPRAPFRPAVKRATARIPAVQHLTGAAEPVGFTYLQGYLDGQLHGLDVFAQLDTAIPLAFARPDQAGGLVSPNMSLLALSRTFGPVAGQDTMDKATFDPGQVFGEGAKLFGTLGLAGLLGPSNFTSPEAAFPINPGNPLIPRIAVDELGAVHFTWETTNFSLSGLAGKVFKAERMGPDKTPFKSTFIIDVVKELAASTRVTSTSTLSNFTLSLPTKDRPLIEIPFKGVTFTATTGEKPDVSVDLATVKFQNELEFVNKLSELIPLGGFLDPPAIEVTADGINAGYSLGLPNVGMGVFLLDNLVLTAGFHLPLVSAEGPVNPIDQASGRFAFSNRENPGLLSVEAFAGSVFIALDVGFDGLRMVEGSLEFGGAFAMSIGVASGGGSVMAGVYYAFVPDGADTLQAFLRANGVLEILGIISISAQFLLTLTYQAPVLTGTAVLSIKVKVLMLSKKVSVPMTRTFASSPPPTFEQAVPKQADWERYLAAFAPEA